MKRRRAFGILAVTLGLISSSFAVKSSADQSNEHRRNGVHVLIATYGGITTPIYNECDVVSVGNSTDAVDAACQGQKTCAFVVDQGVLGDPAPGCWKSFEVIYQCAENGNRIATVDVPNAAFDGGADNHTVVMSCPIQK
jgi:hypothetical protein